MLSIQLRNLIVEQYRHEMQNAYIYDLFSSRAALIGLDGIAEFFAKEAKDERRHARIFLDFLIDRNAALDDEPIILTPPDAPDDPLLMFQLAMDVETGTTQAITNIMRQAQVDGDFITVQFLWNLFEIQREEESTYQTNLDRITSRGEDEATTHDIDVWLKSWD